MRGLFFLDTPHRVAGAQRSLLAAVTVAREMGLDPLMVMPSDGIFGDVCRDAGLEVRVVEGSQAFRTFGKALLRLGSFGKASVVLRELVPYAMALARFIDRERVDVVHFNTGRGAIMAGAGAHLARRGTVLHVRGTPGVARGVWIAAQSIPTRLILVARALEKDLLPSALRRSRVVYNGVRLTSVASRESGLAALAMLGADTSFLSRGPVILSLSSLVPFKGLHHLVRAAVQMKKLGRDAVFLLAGSGLGDDYERYLRTLPEALGVADRVRFLGQVADPTALLSGVDVLVLPSVERELFRYEEGVLGSIHGSKTLDVLGNEGLPRSVLEAMGAGLPVVATAIAGVREQVEDGVSGYVVPPGDPTALAEALARITSDAHFRFLAGQRGRAIVKESFTIEAAAKGLVDVLADAERAARSGDFARFAAASAFEGASAWLRPA